MNGQTARRYIAIDLARGVALVAMASYHLIFDLEMFGMVEPGTASSVPWKPYARAIATTFLMLVGASIYLAYGAVRSTTEVLLSWKWQRRFLMILAAAMLITIVTFLATPNTFIFFGILHQIALASVLALFFRRFTIWALFAAASVIIALPNLISFDTLIGYHGWWVGLASLRPISSDYVPVFPWFGAVLLGLAAAKLAEQRNWFDIISTFQTKGSIAQLLVWCGQHSLAFYLVHQPVIIGLLLAYLWLSGDISLFW